MLEFHQLKLLNEEEAENQWRERGGVEREREGGKEVASGRG